MKIAEAEKLFDDAIEMKAEHAPNVMTEEKVELIAANIFGKDKPSKVLFLKTGIRSSRIIFSHKAYLEDQRQLSMIPGTKVIMTGHEGTFPEYKDKVWDVIHGPQWMCGNYVVWLEGFSGAYSCDYLKIVE